MVHLTAHELELSARVLLRRHGQAAPEEARRQAETCAPGGERHWVATWLVIAELCEELLAGSAGPLTHPAG
ncbi:hypothetical protein [Inquilinus limosus]|uniref:Uncharacterized protein n=1 Tax=Inquilinus limosus TaxID=171674 RepID=A0A211Z060_9PROT|nr:hypothetical protein [Inquilinus limosus]OWJ58639.1 hypothetical protein BWR60_33270 [Inquilinus limosus]